MARREVGRIRIHQNQLVPEFPIAVIAVFQIPGSGTALLTEGGVALRQGGKRRCRSAAGFLVGEQIAVCPGVEQLLQGIALRIQGILYRVASGIVFLKAGQLEHDLIAHGGGNGDHDQHQQCNRAQPYQSLDPDGKLSPCMFQIHCAAPFKIYKYDTIRIDKGQLFAINPRIFV